MQVVASVLQLVVQHAEVQLRQVARWLQLSTAIRRALQQAVGDITVDIAHGGTVQRMTAIARWLPGHAGLVSTLALRARSEPYLSLSEWGAVEQILAFALQICSGSRAGLNSAHAQDPQPPTLQLRCFVTDFVFQPAVLRTIAAGDHLTHLTLDALPFGRCTAELYTTLGSLRSLRELCCLRDRSAPKRPQPFPVEFPAALAELTQLTQLTAVGLLPAASLGQLPASLCRMQLDIGDAAAAHASVRVCISHLTKLHLLDLTVATGLSPQSQLPGCLTALTLTGAAEALPGLSQLQRLDLPNAHAALRFCSSQSSSPDCSVLCWV
jgi:hypothetical protein